MTFKTYGEQLNEAIAEAKQQRKIKAENESLKMRHLERRTKPLTEQITELMISLPPTMQSRAWTMAELVSRLQGKYRDRPHAQNVGAALKILGFARARLYAGGYGGVRVWVPPLSKHIKYL